jgi:hypothetical protein
MVKAIVKLLSVFLGFTLAFITGKLVFLAANASVYSGIGTSEILSIIGHGLSMDFSMAGYFTVIPAILLCIATAKGSKGIIDKIMNAYFIIASLIISLIITVDASLYGYWQFKLDSTPVFYFLSSPSAAFASAEWWHFIVGPLVWLLFAALFYVILYYFTIKLQGDIAPSKGKKAAANVAVMVVMTALLFIPIRGGVTVSTMNLSRAYFSSDIRLNHAAVNPAFSLMYSLSHQNDFASQYRFFDEKENQRLFSMLTEVPNDSIDTPLLSSPRPDIYIIILESFSSHLFPSLGGEPVALKLDSIARDGLLFTNFYANSFRTDRGIPAVLSAYPGQPSTSIMKFVSKTENLPSLSKELKTKGGYSTKYYYGGDANFTNMKAYLVSAGFDEIISDIDFPVGKRLSKWGAHDDVVFDRVAKELEPYDTSHPALKVIQTSSSHEPFEVPYDDKGRFSDKRAKAFAYTDSCVANFITTLRNHPQWQNTLIVVVPDHYGAYPDLTDPMERHKIPLIMTGGALLKRGNDATVGSQIDITATLLNALGIKSDLFPFSRNLLNRKSPHFAFFADPSVIGFVTESGNVVYNLDSSKTESGDEKLLPFAKSFLQTLYDDLSKR